MTRRKAEASVDDKSKNTISTIKNIGKPVNGFIDFVNKHSIISMAIGVVIGQTTKDTVTTMVSGLITPGIQSLMPKTDLQDLVVKMNSAEFRIGEVIDAIIELIIVMLLLYLIFGVLLKREDIIGIKKKKEKDSKKRKPKDKNKKSGNSK